MITIVAAKKIFCEHYPDVIPNKVFMYKDDFYMFETSDGYYMIKKENGEVRSMSPFEDIVAFNNSLLKGPMKNF